MVCAVTTPLHSLCQGSPHHGPLAKTGSAKPFAPVHKIHFANDEKIMYLRKMLIWNVTYPEKITLRKMSSPRTVVQ